MSNRKSKIIIKVLDAHQKRKKKGKNKNIQKKGRKKKDISVWVGMKNIKL